MDIYLEKNFNNDKLLIVIFPKIVYIKNITLVEKNNLFFKFL